MKNTKQVVIVQKYQHEENDGIWDRTECWKKTLEHYKDQKEIGSLVLEDMDTEKYENVGQASVEFVKGDCIEAAIELKTQGMNPLLLNMADWRVAGGCVDLGYQTQEEELFRRSNYHKHLLQKYYPMTRFRTVVSKGVQFWLGKASDGFPELPTPHEIDCVAAPALVGPHTTSDGKDYLKQDQKEIMEKKIRMLLYAAQANGNDSLVLSAWGCGAFHCPIEGTAKLFRKVIEEGVPAKVKKIVFAITGNRFEPFMKGFKN
jgi:uncharacterized protein (TIGR02452 family)